MFGDGDTVSSLALSCTLCPLLLRVKQSELFDRWKSLQMCKWAMNISEANQFKYL